jgi:RNA polymerase sigma-70 factor, ECF subfamily
LDKPKGDGSFDQFYASNSRRLVSQAYLLTGNVDEAEDLAQEALARAWSNWARVSSLQDPAAWARRVLHNLAISRWRRLRTRARLGPRLSAETVSVDLDDRQNDLVVALRLLPVRQRRALVLRAVAGLSTAEIASEMGASTATVRVWLSRARRTLIASVEVHTPDTAKGGSARDAGR